jgi:hypothetical protein
MDLAILPYHDAMTLFYVPSGPLVRYGKGILQIQNLNPEIKTQWRMSRLEMLSFGMRVLYAALRK